MSVLCVFMLTGCGGSGQKTITIATGEKGGLYHQFGLLLKDKLQKQGSITVKLLSTKGSSENAALIQKQQVDFSIVQAGVNTFDGIEVVTPLFIEPILMFATQSANVNDIADLSGKTINLGAEGSGSRITGERILTHYEINSFTLDEGYFSTGKKPTYDVSITVGGLLNKDIKKVVKSQQLKLLPISDAKAIALKHTHLHPFVIPKGIFSQNPPIPQADTTSVASTAILISRLGIDEHLCDAEDDIKYLKSLLSQATNIKLRAIEELTHEQLRGDGLFAIFLTQTSHLINRLEKKIHRNSGA